MNWKFWQKEPDPYPLATSHEQLAGEICAQLGHLSEHAIVEIIKIVVKRMLPKWAVGHKPYQVNPKKQESVTMNTDSNGYVVNE